jgi:hypothetical protein
LDADRFDAFVRSFPVAVPRRIALGGLLGAGLSALLTRFEIEDASAKKKRRKNKKKKNKRKTCKNGTKRCGKGCCAPGTCVGGACCPADRVCGDVCCSSGQRCGAPAVSRCVAGQGTCASGADTCAANDLISCNGTDQCFCVQATDNTTRCARPIADITVEDCGLCSVDSDCEFQFPDIPGVFCAADAINICGCPAGQNLCGAPCPAT